MRQSLQIKAELTFLADLTAGELAACTGAGLGSGVATRREEHALLAHAFRAGCESAVRAVDSLRGEENSEPPALILLPAASSLLQGRPHTGSRSSLWQLRMPQNPQWISAPAFAAATALASVTIFSWLHIEILHFPTWERRSFHRFSLSLCSCFRSWAHPFQLNKSFSILFFCISHSY